ncbi:hypothetical protein HanOQP8_Chr02g0054871 [Helianthus annuus]|nr:hypothetical protein HanOQP8_Chr02g0054871 [Helianthus annuus]
MLVRSSRVLVTGFSGQAVRDSGPCQIQLVSVRPTMDSGQLVNGQGGLSQQFRDGFGSTQSNSIRLGVFRLDSVNRVNSVDLVNSVHTFGFSTRVFGKSFRTNIVYKNYSLFYYVNELEPFRL